MSRRPANILSEHRAKHEDPMRGWRRNEHATATLALALALALGCGGEPANATTGATEAASTGASEAGGGPATSDGDGESTGEGGGWVPPPPVEVPPLPEPPDYSGYPVDEMGRPIVAQGPLVNWVVVRTPDAVSAREGCADLVANCLEPGVRSLDACMLSAPPCATPEPWNEVGPCCADTCFAVYSALRVKGIDPLTAYLKVLYEGPICMPGVDAMLGGTP
jgi:hypothetical protein